ncbi:DUF5979 domain-containing protein [Anaerofustis stercorihominis]|uniref:DUF7601 domain-containing protein n=1 Tax=Anaerofustis stercorihominis TaxID=214853 RepID=UPI002108AAD1|nr:DUF5979 domain-containing protein [Anaerofustis stercorihominis]MCQ4794163.1 DUF5979 domain-containing protein [Anaerofustis stercorihominis]
MRVKRKKRLFLSLLLCAVMFCGFIPQVIAVAATTTDDSLCEHHTEHTEDCGYNEGVEGSPCNYECTICSESESDNDNIAALSADSVASVNGTGYDSLAAAITAAAQSGEPVVLLQDVTDISYLTISSAVTVDLNGHSISAKTGNFVFYITTGNLTLTGSGNINGGGYAYGIIWNTANGTLKIEDSVVLQNNTAGSNGNGGAIYNAGKFIMDGGSIQNTSAGWGGAVSNSGTFTMNDGTISGTSVTNFGGAVYNTGSFEMTGGEISGTSAAYYGGAVYNNGTFEMNGGTIDNCNTTNGSGYGGAVYIAGGTMTMEAGTISNCTTSYGGGGVHVQAGSFTMKDGTIENCKTTGNYNGYWGQPEKNSLGGGGVSVRKDAAFTMTDGLIWKNKTTGGDEGGGVSNQGSFTLSGGQIIMNDTTSDSGYSDDGGGVYNTGSMTMTGGMIAKNCGVGGLYSGDDEATLKMTGGAVFDNYALKFLSSDAPEENKKVDIVLNSDHQGSNDVSVCAASDMEADGYTFTHWLYVGEGFPFATPYVGTEITGTLVPENSELSFTKTNDQIYFRAVSNSGEAEEKEGIYLNGSLGDDEKDGTTAANAVRTFEKAWQEATKALEDGQESVTIYICGKIQVSGKETWGEDDAKNIVVMRADGYKGALAEVTTSGALTLQNITIDGNKGTDYTDSLIHVKGGKLFIQDGTILQNNFAGRTEKGYDGGAVYIEYGTGEMTAGTIQNNTARNNGGGVSVAYGSFTMSGGKIIENTAVYGGGICAVRGAQIKITDNALILKNSANSGGGINLGAYTTAEACGYGKQTLEMTGGTISENSAGRSGGGIFIQSNSVATISKGDIVNNIITATSSFRYRGAGIYVNGGNNNLLDGNGDGIPNGLLQLYNVEIANNKSGEYGGALAACPTANVKIYLTEGAVLHDNQTATNSATDIYIAESKDENSTSYVSDFMLGGGMVQWFWGKTADGIRAEQSKYQNTADEVKLSGLRNDTDVANGVKLATVHITGNYTQSGDGGGIASNGDVIIGTQPDTTAEITISKSWEDSNNKYNTRPDKITLDIQYGDYTLRGIELKEDNNWTTILHNMPNDILKQKNASVNVLEYDNGKYNLGEIKTEIKDNVLTINIENKYTHPTGSLTVEKEVTGTHGDKDKEFNFTVELGDKTISGEYDDMTFKDGVATFALKHGESKTATGLPAGIEYTVTETEANEDGYTTSSDNEKGTIPENDNAAVKFVNHKQAGTDEPDNPSTPNETNNPDNPTDKNTEANTVKTGDQTNMGLYTFLLVMSILCIIILVIWKRKGVRK